MRYASPKFSPINACQPSLIKRRYDLDLKLTRYDVRLSNEEAILDQLLMYDIDTKQKVNQGLVHLPEHHVMKSLRSICGSVPEHLIFRTIR